MIMSTPDQDYNAPSARAAGFDDDWKRISEQVIPEIRKENRQYWAPYGWEPGYDERGFKGLYRVASPAPENTALQQPAGAGDVSLRGLVRWLRNGF